MTDITTYRIESVGKPSTRHLSAAAIPAGEGSARDFPRTLIAEFEDVHRKLAVVIAAINNPTPTTTTVAAGSGGLQAETRAVTALADASDYQYEQVSWEGLIAGFVGSAYGYNFASWTRNGFDGQRVVSTGLSSGGPESLVSEQFPRGVPPTFAAWGTNGVSLNYAVVGYDATGGGTLTVKLSIYDTDAVLISETADAYAAGVTTDTTLRTISVPGAALSGLAAGGQFLIEVSIDVDYANADWDLHLGALSFDWS